MTSPYSFVVENEKNTQSKMIMSHKVDPLGGPFGPTTISKRPLKRLNHSPQTEPQT